ncbi:hypothetical protein [Rhizobium sp. BK176]|uniref:hypothetical protein n=1 Tax=Rhizobium sp. BK176 TaxID=2587071 RepID=UPI002168E611|nr:hypothetical protein [Rhizobium sp. BK176]MCS4088872.1 hypothetical protein [Rhizobium sp. BK176]
MAAGWSETSSASDRGVSSCANIRTGRLLRPGQVNGDRLYHAATDGTGVFTDLTALRGSTFLVDSTVPAINSALEEFQFAINNHTKEEIKKGWYPSSLALEVPRFLRPAVRQLDELDPVRARITEFDHEAFDRQHETLGRKLAETCVAYNGRVLNVERKPFVTVFLKNKEVVVTAEIMDAAEYMAMTHEKGLGDCIKLFPITEKDAAVAFAEEIVSRKDWKLKVVPFEFEAIRPEFLEVDADALQYRLTALAITTRFAAVAKKMGSMRVATEIPYGALDVIRSLVSAVDNPRWTESLADLEAAANAAIDYDEAEGTPYFIDRRNPAQAIVLDLWRDRPVHVELSAPIRTP